MNLRHNFVHLVKLSMISTNVFMLIIGRTTNDHIERILRVFSVRIGRLSWNSFFTPKDVLRDSAVSFAMVGKNSSITLKILKKVFASKKTVEGIKFAHFLTKKKKKLSL